MRNISVQGKDIPARTGGNMVGHQISAMEKRNVNQIIARHDMATLRAHKVKGLAMTRKQKNQADPECHHSSCCVRYSMGHSHKEGPNSTQVRNPSHGLGRGKKVEVH